MEQNIELTKLWAKVGIKMNYPRVAKCSFPEKCQSRSDVRGQSNLDLDTSHKFDKIAIYITDSIIDTSTCNIA